ncbi:hypothetical protein ACTMTU_05240 [Streptomyces sp. OZ13]|uniref:hypothetical protein n=1 Tax=Streptomyces sp. OZ13 TaxID=3452210 RepID=UPI003F8978E6
MDDAGTLKLNKTTISGGAAPDCPNFPGGGACGGGISSLGTLTVRGTNAAALNVHSLVGSLTAVLDQRILDVGDGSSHALSSGRLRSDTTTGSVAEPPEAAQQLITEASAYTYYVLTLLQILHPDDFEEPLHPGKRHRGRKPSVPGRDQTRTDGVPAQCATDDRLGSRSRAAAPARHHSAAGCHPRPRLQTCASATCR